MSKIKAPLDKLAINLVHVDGATPPIKFPLAKDTVQKDDIDSLIEWLKTYPRLTMGALTKQFERDAADWAGRRHAVFVNSGSSANLLMAYALKCSNSLKNNKVVVPNVGWVTSVAPFMQFGFEVIMCKTSPDTFAIDTYDLERICKEDNPGTVLFVQPLGALANRAELYELKRKYGFRLLEDACAAVGSEYISGGKAGSIGDMSTWSMFFGHQICSLAEGGMVFTDDDELNNVLLSIRSHGWLRDTSTQFRNDIHSANYVDDFNKPFFFVYPGFNLRNTDVAAYVGLRQIKKLSVFADLRTRNHKRYLENLKDSGLTFQKLHNVSIVSSISFAMLAKDKEHRRNIVSRLVDNGVECRMYSAGALSKHPFWKNSEHYDPDFRDSVGDRIHDAGFFVPNNQEMSLEDVDYICEIVKSV